MDSFPNDLLGVIRDRVYQAAEVKKQQWMSNQREKIFEGLVCTAERHQPIYAFLFEPTRFQWHVDLCTELLEQSSPSLTVRIFIRHFDHSSGGSGEQELPISQWNKIHLVDVAAADFDGANTLKRKYQAFAKIKMHLQK